MKKVKSKDYFKTKSGKLWLKMNEGKSRAEAAKELGISTRNAADLTQTRIYQELEKSSYKEEILKHITMAQIAQEHIKVLTQDEDLGAKNTAIKMALDKIEPTGEVQENNEKILVILKWFRRILSGVNEFHFLPLGRSRFLPIPSIVKIFIFSHIIF